MARLQLALALVAAVLGSALAFVPLQPAPRAATAVRSSRASPESSSTTGIKPLSVAQALARALAAPALLLTGVLAPSSFDGAAHAISGGGKDWVSAYCVDFWKGRPFRDVSNLIIPGSIPSNRPLQQAEAKISEQVRFMYIQIHQT